MNDKSSYLRFLPPVLWQAEPDAPSLSLGSALRIFEKILTGIDDGVAMTPRLLEDGTSVDREAIGAIIARLSRLFDPWAAPAEFLPWLASCVGLALPALWDEYQCRMAIGKIVGVYRQRGLKPGLDALLTLHAVSDKRPRVAIDEGARVLTCEPARGDLQTIAALVSHGPVVRRDKSLLHSGPMRPQCIARAPDGTLYLGDIGSPSYLLPQLSPAVWAISPQGSPVAQGTPPVPQPIGPAPWDPNNAGAPVFPIAIAIDTRTPWNLYVLDGVTASAQTALYALASPAFTVVTKVASKAALGLFNPVAMAFDANGHLLILDRGAANNPPRVVDLDVTTLVTATHVLGVVVAPFSLAVLANGDLVIGDGGDQTRSQPAALVQVNRTNANWVETSLLAAVAAGSNPLVAPTAVVEFASGLLLVLDAGLKPLVPGADDPLLAEPAALYWIDLAPDPPVVTRASEARGMVMPHGMVLGGREVFICDPGEPEVAGFQPRVWRALDHEFGVVVHFCQQRPATAQERRRIVNNIRDIVEQGKPAHTSYTISWSV